MRMVPTWEGLVEHDDKIDQLTVEGMSTPCEDQVAFQKPLERDKSIVEEFEMPPMR